MAKDDIIFLKIVKGGGSKNMANVLFAKMKDGARVPSKREEDAGFDFYACFKEDFLRFEPFETKLVSTGIACVLPKGCYMQIEERSSVGAKGLKKSGGVIDNGYRGEILLAMFNANKVPAYISKLPHEQIEKLEKGQFVYFSEQKAIAQGIVHKLPAVKAKEISYNKLKQIPSQRKDGGFGSTKK